MNRLILLVDDNLVCAEPLQIALESIAGVEVQVMANAQTALALLKAFPERVAAVVTDLRMPTVSGLELLQTLQADAVLRTIPVLVVSGDSDPEMPARAYSHGAAAFFTKPYSPLALRSRLEQLLT